MNKAQLVDAIAENLTPVQVAARITAFNPALVIYLTSSPSFEEDVPFLRDLKEQVPQATFVGIGDIYREIRDDALTLYPGHIQIHAKGYWEDKTIYNSAAPPEELIASLSADPRVKAVTTRLTVDALKRSQRSVRQIDAGVLFESCLQVLEQVSEAVDRHLHSSAGKVGP